MQSSCQKHIKDIPSKQRNPGFTHVDPSQRITKQPAIFSICRRDKTSRRLCSGSNIVKRDFDVNGDGNARAKDAIGFPLHSLTQYHK